ncbi:fimbrial protein [Escherichia coli]|uniref:fimbrial protein n=1 Tax=Escherichia coli TaxID=562 RepID=UPI00207CA92B|nr:fimbrial protein [Escherichia coli]
MLGKSCTPVINGSLLAEVQFPTIAASDLMHLGQSDRVPLVFQLKDCKSSTLFSVRVTLAGTEDSELPGFLAIDASSSASGVGIGIETAAGAAVPINDTTGVTFPLNQGSNTLNFNAWLQTKSGRDVTPGDFSATATATFEYF